MPTSGSKPASPARTVSLIAWASFTPPPAVTRLPAMRICEKAGLGEAHDHAAHPFVAHQDVRTAAQQANRHIFVAAAADQSGQFVDRIGLREELRRAAQPEPGALC